jgi:hypothetical protein
MIGVESMRTVSCWRGESPAYLIVAALLALEFAGCHGNRSTGGNHKGEGELAGHAAPAHKPKDFPEAVRRLRASGVAIKEGISRGRPGALLEDQTLPIALDVATWLPEIAADSDMPEKPWDVVNEQSKTLVAAYVRLIDQANGKGAGDANLAAQDADRSVSVLEGFLAEADARWFEGIARRDTSPR